MVGVQSIRVSNKRVEYSIQIHRKISIIRGNSGTGKTTFVNMLLSYQQYGRESGVKLTSTIPVHVLTGDSIWDYELERAQGSIFIADEGVRFIYSSQFQRLAAETDNYFIFITRRDKFNILPFAIKTIYQFETVAGGRDRYEWLL